MNRYKCSQLCNFDVKTAVLEILLLLSLTFPESNVKIALEENAVNDTSVTKCVVSM